MQYFDMIFKRKSFHIFKNTERITEDDLAELKSFFGSVKPLDDSIRTSIKIVPEAETSCRRGAQYCIEFYSEERGNYLRNIGYIGEQIDLWLAEKNIGALWFGIGKPDDEQDGDLKFVIMIAIAKMPEQSFRKDMFKSKRKAVDEIWQGEKLPLANIVRFAPSACNTQPWMVSFEDNVIKIRRYKKPGKRGIMPADKVRYYNRIDMGIFLFFLEVCLEHDGYAFESEQYYEDEPDNVETAVTARYVISRNSNVSEARG